MNARRLDPLLLTFLDSAEHALARALEVRHRTLAAPPWPVTGQIPCERIATLQRTIDVLQVAIGRGDSALVH